MEECRRLLSAVTGADHLAFRFLIELGLPSEGLFALRRNDALGDMLRIDEAIVEGASLRICVGSGVVEHQHRVDSITF